MKKFYIYLSLIACISVLSSCMQNKKEIQDTEVKEPIVITIDGIKNNYDTVFFDTGYALINTPVFLVNLSPTQTLYLEVADTIRFIPEQDCSIVSHKFLPYAYMDFILNPGDSIRIKYINDLPSVTILNRETKPFDINYEYHRIKRYPLIEGMRSLDIVSRPHILLMKKQNTDKNITNKSIISNYYPKLLNELEDERIWLDSLHEVNLLSDKEYNFYKDKNKYTTLTHNIQDRNPEDILSELHSYDDSTYRSDQAGYYKKYMYSIARQYVNTNFNGSNENLYAELYEFIDSNKNIKGQLSVDLRKNLIVSMLTQAPFELRKEYFDKFASSVNDTALINNMKKEYHNMLTPELANSEVVILQTTDGEKTTLDKILKQCKGKVVYVDFWASWCMPCLEEMAISKEIREDITYKDVIFIYLAINDKQSDWEKAWGKAGLTNQQHNYLILNPKDASFIKDNKIGSIPRYMIFDRNGQLVNADAPRPSDKNLINFLNL